jgi:LacI family transcriptional regulator/LacI family repressor for deo operon, udp, cdd, tsx, nupC, and nupG
MPATIKTIAAATGLSASTVSRALSSRGRVNASTKDRVFKAAQELGYQPNLAAKALVTGRSRTIALIVPTVTNPFFTALLKGAQARARSLGYMLVLGDSDEDSVLERELVTELLDRSEGMILAATPSPSAGKDVAGYGKAGAVVLINRDAPGVLHARPDVSEGLRQALEHLAALGHHRVAYVRGSVNSWMDAHQQDILKEQASRLELELSMLGPYTTTSEGGEAAVDTIIASGASAVIAFNDLMALGISKRAHERGLSVPNDLSVVGIDDIPYAAMAQPSLTTIRLNPSRIGRGAVDLLVNAIERPDLSSDGATFPTELIVRGSTGAAPN